MRRPPLLPLLLALNASGGCIVRNATGLALRGSGNVVALKALKPAVLAWLNDLYPPHYDFSEPAEHTLLVQRAALLFEGSRVQ